MKYEVKLKQHERRNCFYDVQTVLINIRWKRNSAESAWGKWKLPMGSVPARRHMAEAGTMLKLSWNPGKRLNYFILFFFWKNLKNWDSTVHEGGLYMFWPSWTYAVTVEIPNIYSYIGLGWGLPWNRFPSIVHVSTRWLQHLLYRTAVWHEVLPACNLLNCCSRIYKNRYFILS